MLWRDRSELYDINKREIKNFTKTSEFYFIEEGISLLHENKVRLKFVKDMKELKQVLLSNTISLEDKTILNTPKFITYTIELFKENPDYNNLISGGSVQASISSIKRLNNNMCVTEIV